MTFETLEQAKRHIMQGRSSGVACPCCTQLCKIYRRSLYAAPVAALCRLYRHAGGRSDRYVHMDDIGTPSSGGGDFSKLKMWSMIEAAPEEMHNDPKTKTSGLWRITEHGIRFVEGRSTAAKYCMTYLNEPLEFLEPRITVHEALAGKFDYAELTGRLI